MKKYILLIITLLLFFTNCTHEQVSNYQFFALNTHITVRITGTNNDHIYELLTEEVTRLENLFSVTKSGSDIERINHRTSDSVTIAQETQELLQYSIELANSTQGCFEPTIYPALLRWGFTTQNYQIPSVVELERLKELVDYHKIILTKQTVTLTAGMLIDLGGVAKGYIGDQIIKLLKANGVTSAMVNIGGNVQTLGGKDAKQLWKIGIYSPLSQSDFATVRIKDQAVITSGQYERNFIGADGKCYGHIIDPKTLYPVENELVSLTVITREGKKGDALSTALFVMGLVPAINYYRENTGFEIVLLTNDKVYVSAGIADDFTLENNQLEMEVISRE